MEEDQVDLVPLVPDAKPPLATNKGERTSEFQEERLELLDKRLLKVALGVFILEIEELENEGALNGTAFKV